MATAYEQANRFEQALIEGELRYERVDEYERPMFRLNFGGGDFKFNHICINVLFDTDGESAQFVTSTIVSIPQEKTAQAIIACNATNLQYRWIKFYVDGDNDLIAEADAVITEESVGDVCTELVFRTASIIDSAYGDFMKVVWS